MNSQDEAKKRLMGVSHDFKNALASIKVLNQVLSRLYRQKKYEQAQAYFQKIDAKVNLLTEMVNQLTQELRKAGR